MKQTATDYLYDQFLKAFIQYVEDKIDGARFSELMIEARVKSQQMEKEQIVEAYNIGRNDKHNDFSREAEQYYNETYKQ